MIIYHALNTNYIQIYWGINSRNEILACFIMLIISFIVVWKSQRYDILQMAHSKTKSLIEFPLAIWSVSSCGQRAGMSEIVLWHGNIMWQTTKDALRLGAK